MNTLQQIRVLSWGCGTQSTALAELSARGILPRLDLIITADTGWERAATYEIREYYAKRWRKMGMNVAVVQVGNTREQGTNPHVHMPFWTPKTAEHRGGPLTRACTHHFKILPIKRSLRMRMGYHYNAPPHPPKDAIELWLGISLDEYTRMKHSHVKFIRHKWPLIDMKWTRTDCIEFFESENLPVPIKSACVGCPYRTASEWIEMRENSPNEYNQAVQFDQGIRNVKIPRVDADEIFLYKRSMPLATAPLEQHAAREKKGKQLPMMICESGYCMV